MKIRNQADHLSDVSRFKVPGQQLGVGLVLRQFVSRLFALTALANLHRFLLYALIFGLTPFG
jgi:hypothetical protein